MGMPLYWSKHSGFAGLDLYGLGRQMKNRSTQTVDDLNDVATLPGTDPLAEVARDQAAWPVALVTTPQDPPAGLFDKIEAALDEAADHNFVTTRAHEGEWTQRTEHIWQKILHQDADTGRKIYYLRCYPGAVIPPHQHDHDEHVLVLEGSFQIEGTTVRTGDTHFSRAGTLHSEISTAEGCLLLLHV